MLPVTAIALLIETSSTAPNSSAYLCFERDGRFHNVRPAISDGSSPADSSCPDMTRHHRWPKKKLSRRNAAADGALLPNYLSNNTAKTNKIADTQSRHVNEDVSAPSLLQCHPHQSASAVAEKAAESLVAA